MNPSRWRLVVLLVVVVLVAGLVYALVTGDGPTPPPAPLHVP